MAAAIRVRALTAGRRATG